MPPKYVKLSVMAMALDISLRARKKNELAICGQ
jgi:hypothetical protein